MKIEAGEKVVCECGHECGKFNKDVSNQSNISCVHFEVEGEYQLPDGYPGWGCAKCHKPVALRTARGWRVRTSNGWNS